MYNKEQEDPNLYFGNHVNIASPPFHKRHQYASHKGKLITSQSVVIRLLVRPSILHLQYPFSVKVDALAHLGPSFAPDCMA